MTLAGAVKTLGRYYGPPVRPPTADPFGLILLENVAYLASAGRRREAFDELKRTIGVTPRAIRDADRKSLERVTARGILKETFAEKLLECADIAITRFGGDMKKAICGPIESAARALRAFPGIGEPGAEKILLFAGRAPLLAPDSNALRVLVRLGFVPEDSSYARTYRASRAVAGQLPQSVRAMQTAHLLLQLHGQTLCRRRAPRCARCPVARECRFFRSRRTA